MVEPRIAFDNKMWKAQDLSWNPHIAHHALVETTFASMMYHLACEGKIPIEPSDNINIDKLREDAISLSLGILTIEVPHEASCNRLICNCKFH